MSRPRSPVNPMWHLLMAHQQESFHPFSSRQSLSCFLSHVAKGSTPKPHGPNLCQSCVVPEKTRGPKQRHQMAAMPGFKSQRQSSSAAPFLAPPTIGYSCQHSRQVWPCGVEPIISKLFWTPLQIPIWGPPLGFTLLQYHRSIFDFLRNLPYSFHGGCTNL